MKEIKEYERTAIDIIKGSEILEEGDFMALKDYAGELTHSFLTAQMFRTKTEMEISVLNDVKFPTPDSKYWQAIREQNVMFEELVFLSYEYRKNQVEINQAQENLKKNDDKYEKELIQIEIEKKQFIAKLQEKTAKHRIREIKEWHEIKDKLLPHLKYGNKEVNSHQLESYNERFKRQAQIAGNSGSLPERINLLGQLVTAKDRLTKLLKK